MGVHGLWESLGELGAVVSKNATQAHHIPAEVNGLVVAVDLAVWASEATSSMASAVKRCMSPVPAPVKSREQRSSKLIQSCGALLSDLPPVLPAHRL